MTRAGWLVTACAAVLAAGCDGGGDGATADGGVVVDAGPADIGGSPDAGPASKFPYHDFYMEVRAKLDALPAVDGDWADDQGDAAYYGVAFYVSAGTSEHRSDFLDKAKKGRQHDLVLIRGANGDLSTLMNNLEENLMAVLGLIEHMAATGDTKVMPDVETFMDNLNDLVTSMGPYLEVDVNSWALKMYGPTTITGVVALINLRYAMLLSTDRTAERLAFGLSIIAAVDEKAWNGTYYRFSTTVDRVDLYPNVMMVIANAIAYQLTKEEAYRGRCVAVYQAIQPLKYDFRKGYYSQYSAESQGAKTDDYSTLSSQNYAIMAMAMLYEITGDDAYKGEILDLVSFIKDALWVDGLILHHWMDGRVAVPTDPEFFCSGCNFQFLYVMWYVEGHVYDL